MNNNNISQESEVEKLKDHILYLEQILKENKIQFKEYQSAQEQQEQESAKTKLSKPFTTNLKEQILNKQQIERYSRQMLLEELGYEGQKKISSSKILVVGAGGIGAPALQYLAGMGVGDIGIIDDDCVEESNLHRQVIHNQNRVGINKARSARQTLKQFNKRVNIEIYEYRLNNKNANKIFQKYDIILDASDNPKTRYLVNDAAITNKKVLVSGSAIGWEGQLTVYGHNNGPCYRCLFPVSPKGSGVKSCGEAGVIGMIPGIIGQLEALEALKIMLNREGTLAQQLLLFDGKTAGFKRVKIRPRQKTCAVCGQNPTIKNVEEFDYDEFVGEQCQANIIPQQVKSEFNHISWEDFVDFYKKEESKKNSQFVDVRFASQNNIVHFKEFLSVPYDEIQELKNFEKKFDKNKNIYIMCRRGINSQTVCKQLIEKGYKNVTNIKGGMESYAKVFDETIPFF